MGYFFRKSLSFGPIRLNLSKSGVGASIGVKGARLTMRPRGTTYITVGSHGFYYREALSHVGDGSAGSSASPGTAPVAPPADDIVTADVSDLVDSSSEALLGRLNERAQMFNPAWVLYAIAAALLVGGVVMLSNVQTLPDVTPPLPDVTSPFTAERKDNTTDEYPMLLGRYGEPDSVLSSELATVPVGTAHYSSANVSVVFVPNGCVEAYDEAMRSLAERSGKGRMRNTKRCVPQPNAGWTIVGYKFAADDLGISPESAKVLLDKITVKRTSPPSVEIASGQGPKQKANAGNPAKRQTRPRPELQSDEQARALEAQMTLRNEQASRNAEAAERRGHYSGSALLLGSLGLFVIGGVAHKKNTAKRTSRLFYELDETQRQKFSTVHQALAYLSKSERIWRIDADTTTSDWKRNAGASSLVRRRLIAVGNSCPPRVETNVAVPCVNTGDFRLFFMPDLILLLQGGRFGGVPYDDFRVQQSSTRFIEDGYVAADATVVGRTWRYVNKNGGPDRRFSNNVQLPILQYGIVVLGSSKGLNIHLQASSLQQSTAFANCWRTFAERTSDTTGQQSPPRDRVVPPASGVRDRARKILGVNDTATESEISAAYRRLAQMYHPDKVVGLAPEFQVLADTREINAAYGILVPRPQSGSFD